MREIITEYKVFRARSDGLTNEVSRHIAEGWQPFGGVASGENDFSAQALVRYSEAPPPEIAYVSGDSLAAITEKIQERVREGWSLLGSLIINPIDSLHRYIQTVARGSVPRPQ